MHKIFTPTAVEARALKYPRGVAARAHNRWGCPPRQMPRVEE